MDVLDQEDDRLVRIVSKREVSAAKKPPRKVKTKPNPKPRPARKPRVKKMKARATATAKAVATDAAGIKSKPELADDLQDKRVPAPPMADKRLRPSNPPATNGLRVALDPSSGVISGSVGYDLEHDPVRILHEHAPFNSAFGRFSERPQLGQGVLFI